MYFSFSCFLFEFLVVSLKEHLLLHISVFILDFPNQIEFIKSNKEWFKMDFLHMNFNREKVQFGVNRSFFSLPFRIRISYFDCIEKKKENSNAFVFSNKMHSWEPIRLICFCQNGWRRHLNDRTIELAQANGKTEKERQYIRFEQYSAQ